MRATKILWLLELYIYASFLNHYNYILCGVFYMLYCPLYSSSWHPAALI